MSYTDQTNEEQVRRLRDDKLSLIADILLRVGSVLLLVCSYLYYNPSAEAMKPAYYVLFIVMLWVLLSLPSYFYTIFLEDYYQTKRQKRQLLVATIVAMVAQILIVLLNFKPFLAGFRAENAYKLVFSITMVMLFGLPLINMIGSLTKLPYQVVQLFALITACTGVIFGVVALRAHIIPAAVSSLSYILYGTAYFLTIPGAYTYRDEHPAKKKHKNKKKK